MPTITQDQVNKAAWAACDTFRGIIDPANYKDYILTMLFLKYLSDLWLDKKADYEARYKGDAVRVQRALARERFVLPAQADFHFLFAQRERPNIGELINIALQKIEDENKTKLEGVFRTDFNSERLGPVKEKNRRLQKLLEDFHVEELNFRRDHVGQLDILGNTYEYLIGRFASEAGKKAGEFFTPPEVSRLLARLVRPKSGDRICDPTCGSGSLLLKVAAEIPDGNCSLFGMEMMDTTWALCRMNMFLHERDGARIDWCDTLNGPRLLEDDELMKFDVVVANPPFSLDKWGAEHAASDKFNRFWRGIPPKSKGDYAFISHMLETAVENGGRVGVVVPHGVLFRGGAEGKIRQQILDENLLDGVVGLPANLFYGAGIPAALMLFEKGRKRKDVFFIDASREFEKGTTQNHLTDAHLDRIVAAYTARKDIPKYAALASLERIRAEDYNLNIPRYVDTFEEEEQIDLAAVQADIDRIEKELATVRKQMAAHLKALGLV